MFIVLVILLVYNLAYLREVYHIGDYDSANRLVLQALLLVLLYLNLSFCKVNIEPIRSP